MHNTGSVAGAEVVQAYVQDLECANDRPIRELKAFDKVWIEAGSSLTAKLSLDKYALSYWNEEHLKWIAEKGVFRVITARSSDPNDEVASSVLNLEEDFLWTGV